MVQSDPMQDLGVDHPRHLLAPIPEFISGGFFGAGILRKSLKPDGLLAVNVLGPEAHTEAVKGALAGYATVVTYIPTPPSGMVEMMIVSRRR